MTSYASCWKATVGMQPFPPLISAATHTCSTHLLLSLSHVQAQAPSHSEALGPGSFCWIAALGAPGTFRLLVYLPPSILSVSTAFHRTSWAEDHSLGLSLNWTLPFPLAFQVPSPPGQMPSTLQLPSCFRCFSSHQNVPALAHTGRKKSLTLAGSPL